MAKLFLWGMILGLISLNNCSDASLLERVDHLEPLKEHLAAVDFNPPTLLSSISPVTGLTEESSSNFTEQNRKLLKDKYTINQLLPQLKKLLQGDAANSPTKINALIKNSLKSAKYTEIEQNTLQAFLLNYLRQLEEVTNNLP